MHSMSLLFLLSTIMGTGTDLLDYVPSDDYWKAKGVTAVTVEALLKELEPPKAGADISKLVPDLGSPDAKVRDAAAAKVRAMGPGVIPQLKELAKHDDPEVAGRARLLITEIGNAAKSTQVRRLMAIRTLGEKKAKEALPRLAELVRSSEPFVADYAKSAMAAIEGRPYARHHDFAGDDAWLLPEDCRAVLHMAMRGGKPVDFDAAMKGMPMMGPHGDVPPGAAPGAAPRAPTPQEFRKKVVDEIIKTADLTGNIRLDGITVGVDGNVGNNTGFVAIIVHGEFDAKAVSALVGGLMGNAGGAKPADAAPPGAGAGAAPGNPPRPPANVVDGVEVFGEGEFAFLFPSDKYAVFIGGPREADKPIAKLIAAARTGKGGLKDSAEMANLIKTVDTRQPLWGALHMTDNYRQAPVISAFDSITLVGKPKAGAEADPRSDLDVRLRATGKDAQQVKDAVAQVNAGVAQGRQELKKAEAELSKRPGGAEAAVMLPTMQRIGKLLETVQCTAEGQTATLTATVTGDMLFSPMMILGGFGMARAEVHEARAVDVQAAPDPIQPVLPPLPPQPNQPPQPAGKP